MFMKKKFLILAVLLCMSVILLPANAFGVSAFEFRYLNDDPDTGHRIGIKSIVIDGITYYDIYDGDPNRTAPNNSIQFLREVLTKPDKTAGDANVLDYWAQLAYHVFEDNHVNGSFTADINASGGFEANFGRRGGSTDGGYADLVKDLSSITLGSRSNTGSNSDDKTVWTGLATAKSLKDVRQRMADAIASGRSDVRGQRPDVVCGREWRMPSPPASGAK